MSGQDPAARARGGGGGVTRAAGARGHWRARRVRSVPVAATPVVGQAAARPRARARPGPARRRHGLAAQGGPGGEAQGAPSAPPPPPPRAELVPARASGRGGLGAAPGAPPGRFAAAGWSCGRLTAARPPPNRPALPTPAPPPPRLSGRAGTGLGPLCGRPRAAPGRRVAAGPGTVDLPLRPGRELLRFPYPPIALCLPSPFWSGPGVQPVQAAGQGALAPAVHRVWALPALGCFL